MASIQATLGWVSPDVRAISVDVADHDEVKVNFAVRGRTVRVEEDIEEIVGDLDAALQGQYSITPMIFVGTPDESWPGRQARLIFLEYHDSEADRFGR
ncbi:hypothetical protein ACFXHA_40230 [Nocardia sp. NPDC059240]|uniref:hypothetical protein n=1 Tax=Nocardia sp. NPDC059240 TaxID=3346786 RepID=UPI003679E15F